MNIIRVAKSIFWFKHQQTLCAILVHYQMQCKILESLLAFEHVRQPVRQASYLFQDLCDVMDITIIQSRHIEAHHKIIVRICLKIYEYIVVGNIPSFPSNVCVMDLTKLAHWWF